MFWTDQGAKQRTMPVVAVVLDLKPTHLHHFIVASPAGLSYNSILGTFMVFSTDTDVSRKMLSVNDPSSLLMAVHPSARNILGE